MDATPPKDLARTDLAADLQATLAARRELDPAMEEHLVESFLARIEERVDARVDAKLSQIQLNRPKPPVKSDDMIGMVAVTMALGIPLMVIAGIFVHGAGV